MTNKKPEKLQDKDLDQVQGGVIDFEKLLVSSVKDDRPKNSDLARPFMVDGPYS